MKGEEDKLFDDFLRKSVGNFRAKPSPGIWQNILQKLPARKIGRIPFSGGHSGLISIISGGILITSVAIYNHNSQKHHNNHPVESSGILAAQTVNQKPADSSRTAEIIIHDSIDKPIDQINTLNNRLSEQNTPLNRALYHTGKSQKQSGIAPVTVAMMQAAETSSTLEKTEAETKSYSSETDPVLKNTLINQPPSVNTPAVLAMNENKGNVLEDLRVVQSDKSSYFTVLSTLDHSWNVFVKPQVYSTRELKITKWKGDYAGNPNALKLGVYYHPEWLYHQKDSEYDNIRQSFGMNVSLNKGPFIIETGLGVMQEKARQDYDVRFNQFLGTFNDLQYIEFDSIGGVMVPDYHYNVDSVFDPEETQELHSHLAEYTYLQVPLFIGIEKSLGRNSFTIKGGPIFNILLDKKEERLLYGSDQKIISIDGDHPDRLKTSWQWYLGVGYSYALTDKLSFFLEPAVRGYLGTPYEKKRKSAQNPVYVGIRTGITFQLKNPLMP